MMMKMVVVILIDRDGTVMPRYIERRKKKSTKSPFVTFFADLPPACC